MNKSPDSKTDPKLLKLFNFQNWPVYKISLEFCIKVHKIRTKCPKIGQSSLSDQLTRASSSIPLNLAEGYSRLTKRDKQTFLRIAKGSVFECVAIIDILKNLEMIDSEFYGELHFLLSEMSQMIAALINYIQSNLKRI